MNSWVPGHGYMQFSGRHYPAPEEEFVPVSDPDPRSPYHIPAVPVPPVSAEPAVEPVLSAAEKAKAFLVAELAVDPVPSLRLQERASEAGIKWRTIRRVAKAVGVRVFKDGRGAWMWGLKDNRSDDGQEPAASRAL
jgi:hypothetical protein